MPNTYTQLYVQFVFAVKGRESLISKSIRVPIEKYITGITRNSGHKMLALYAMPDHCHILVGLNPKQSISDLAHDIKSNSSKWINERGLVRANFAWQQGFGAFSYAKNQVSPVINYILNQPEHHRNQNFREEYLAFLKEFEIDYKPEYLFDWIKD